MTNYVYTLLLDFLIALGVVARQVTIILSAFLGAHLGYLLISILARGPVK